MNKNYNVEKFRVLAAVMVVYIHASAFMSSQDSASFFNYFFWRRIADWGVIYFFAVTGFFIASHKNVNKIDASIKNHTKILIITTISAFLTKSLINVIRKLLFGESLVKSMKRLLSTVTLSNMLTGEVFTVITWYFVAAIIALTIFRYFIKFKFDRKTILFISLIIWVLTTFRVIDINSLITYGGFPKALLCISVGYYCSDLNISIKHSKQMAIILVILSSIVAFKRYELLFPGLLFSVYLTLNYCKEFPGNENFISKLSIYTLPVYVFHQFFISVTNLIFDYFSIERLEFQLLYIIISLLLSFLFSKRIFDICEKIYQRVFSYFVKPPNGKNESR